MMNRMQKKELSRLAGDGLQFDCSMAQYTTFRVGGKVEALYEVQDLEFLRRIIAYLNEEHIPYLVVGRGSNLLVKDSGLAGLAILLRGSLATIERKPVDDMTVLAGAGVLIVDFLTYCRASGLGGLEFLAGIPGTIGGALAMNAGAFRKEIGTKVQEIQMITLRGELLLKNRSQLRFSYRTLKIERGEVIVKCSFKVARETEEVVGEQIANYLRIRKKMQPLGYPSAGSVFKNPPGEHAGRLIEQVGLKGERMGGAMISKKHANFIVNTDDAKAEDILGLLNLARQKVKQETGIELEPEIKVIGE